MPKLTSKSVNSSGLRLIKMIKQYPELYDTNHELAKDRTHKKLVWENISEDLHTPVEVLKKQWETLRTTYIKRCRDSDAGRVIKATPYDEALAFLMSSVIEYSNTDSCADSDSSSTLEGEDCSVRSMPQLSVISEEKSTASNSTVSVLLEASTPNLQNIQMSGLPQKAEVASVMTSDRVLRSRRHESSTSDDREDVQRIVNSTSRRVASPSVRNKKLLGPNDPTRCFFESMALTVATFPPHLRATVKMQICNIVSDTEHELSSPMSR